MATQRPSGDPASARPQAGGARPVIGQIRSLVAFARVADADSAHGAARSLRLPPSFGSTLDSDLKGSLGVVLLHRSTRK